MWQISSGRRPFYDESYLYTKCWKGEPNEHPDIREVVLKLQTISFKRDDTSFIDTNEENVTTMEISKEFSDMNQDLLIDNIPNMIGPKSTSSCSIIMEHENHLSVTLSTDSFDANYLFNRLYNVSHQKSPPTCFILLKTVLGLIAKDKDIKVVGMLQSVLAAAILRAADRINS
ncbi:unnamed protein product [Rhizophagus irregularis]|nr:unnamed protein product [Rhizophagus irregularis]